MVRMARTAQPCRSEGSLLCLKSFYEGILHGLNRVVDVDLSGYFDNIRHHLLLEKIARRMQDDDIMYLVKLTLKANWNKPLKEVIQTVNAIIRGWVNYFRIGNSNSTFNKVRNYIEMKVRRFVMRRKKLKGFGWRKWSREEIYGKWGLYNDYRIRYVYPKANPSR